MWGSVKSKLLEVMDLLVPSKIATMRHKQPWITREVKRLSSWKQRAYTKAKRSSREQDWKRYKKLKRCCQEECRSGYNTYITGMIAPDMDSCPKKFWSFIKSKHTDKCGIAPLKDEEGLTYSEPAAKAEILNKQFSSVFTCDDLSHNLPDQGPSPYDPMGRITTNGVYKLLAGIKIHKATGTDGIPGRLLKELASKHLPQCTRHHLTKAGFSSTGKLHLLPQPFRKVTATRLRTTVRFHWLPFAVNWLSISFTVMQCDTWRIYEFLQTLSMGFVSIVLVRLSWSLPWMILAGVLIIQHKWTPSSLISARPLTRSSIDTLTLQARLLWCQRLNESVDC